MHKGQYKGLGRGLTRGNFSGLRTGLVSGLENDKKRSAGKNRLLIGIIGDSISDGDGQVLGPVTPMGAMQAWNGSAFVDITTTDINNFAPTTRGTQYKQFALDYFNRTGGQIRFVNRGVAGSSFVGSGAGSWDSGVGLLYAPARTALKAARAIHGKNFDYLIVDLGINDMQSIVSLLLIDTAIDLLFSSLQADFPGVPILVVNIGSSNQGNILNNPRQYHIRWKIREKARTLNNVTIVFNNACLWQAGVDNHYVLSDDVHPSQEGNNLKGTSFANYIRAKTLGFSQRASGEIGCILVDNPGDQISIGYMTAYANLIDKLITDGNYFTQDGLFLYNGFSYNMSYSGIASLCGMVTVDSPSFVQYRGTDFDGVNDWHGEWNVDALNNQNTTNTDFNQYVRLAANNTANPSTAALFGKQITAGSPHPLDMLRQNSATNVSYVALDQTTSLGTFSRILPDVLYSVRRVGTLKSLYRGTTLDASATAAIINETNGGLARMALVAVATALQFFAGRVQVVGVAKATGFDWDKFDAAIDTYVNAVKAL